MATPRKSEIMEKAIALWKTDQVRSGCGYLAEIEPELEELRESGYLSNAQSVLMRDQYKAAVDSATYFEIEDFGDFQFNVEEGMRTTTFVGGGRGCGKSDVAMRIVDAVSNEGVITVVFDSSTDWLKRSSVSQYLTVEPYMVLPVPDENTIFDISRLTPIQQQRVVESFCETLFEHQLTSDRRRYIVFEEAQLFFPLNSLRSKKTQNSMRLLTVGRNVGVSMCTISQFPSTIDKELVKNAGQMFIGYTAEKNAVEYWKSVLGKHGEALKTLENGSFMYYSRNNNISKISFEPYESAVRYKKTRLDTAPKICLPEKTPRQQNFPNGLVSLCIASMWFISILLALATMP